MSKPTVSATGGAMPAEGHPDAELLALAAQCEAAARDRGGVLDEIATVERLLRIHVTPERKLEYHALWDALATTTDRFYALAERLAGMPATTAEGQRAKARVAAKANPIPREID